MNELKLLDEAKTPGLSKWAEKFCADGAVKGVMLETVRLIEFAKVVQDKMRDYSSKISFCEQLDHPQGCNDRSPAYPFLI